MKIIKQLFFAIIFLAVGFFLGQGYQVAKLEPPAVNQAPEQSLKCTLVLQFAENDILEIQNLAMTANQTVLSLLSKVTAENNLNFQTKDYGELGVMVTQIGDKINGQDNKYWQYWVNGKFAEVGADKYQLLGGERIEWKFIESTF